MKFFKYFTKKLKPKPKYTSLSNEPIQSYYISLFRDFWRVPELVQEQASKCERKEITVCLEIGEGLYCDFYKLQLNDFDDIFNKVLGENYILLDTKLFRKVGVMEVKYYFEIKLIKV
jgi:hypothetical protein